MFQKSLKISLAIISFLMLLFLYLLSDLNPIFNNKEFVYLNIKLKEAQSEDLSSFVKIQTEIYKKIDDPECPCNRATDYVGPYRHGYSLTKSLYKLKVEKEFSKMDCFKFLLLNTDFKGRSRDSKVKIFGVKQASKFYFNKNINELNEKDILTLIAMLKKPSLYDPIRNKKGVKNRVGVLERILHK